MTALLAADPAVPMRDALLDPATFAGRYGGPGAQPLGLARARYRAGESLRVVHRIAVGGEVSHVAARSAGDHVRVSRFPADRKIAALPQLLEGDLDGLVGRPVDDRRLVAYAPERSAAVACLAEGEIVAYAKAFAGDEAVGTERTHAYLAAVAPGLPVPRLLGRTGRLVAVEALAGSPLRDLHGARYWLGLRDLGALLAAFHAIPAPDFAPRFGRHDAAALHEAVATIARVRPELRDDAAAVADLLAAGPPAAPDACLHGDVHAGNVLVTPAGIALIDLDDLSRGPAAADLGSLLAALRYRQLTGAVDARATTAAVAAVLEGYGAASPPPAAIAWHEAASLLAERAQRAVTRIRPEGLRSLGAILAAAHDRAREATCRAS